MEPPRKCTACSASTSQNATMLHRTYEVKDEKEMQAVPFSCKDTSQESVETNNGENNDAFVSDASKIHRHTCENRQSYEEKGTEDDRDRKHLSIYLKSFGYKYGKPDIKNVDKLVNARTLPNPGTAKTRQRATGLNKDCAKEVLKQEAATEIVDDCVNEAQRLMSIFFNTSYLPGETHREQEEEFCGDTVWTLAVGCESGLHRSVSLAEEIYRQIKQLLKENELWRHAVRLTVEHRDIEKRSERKGKGHKIKHR